MYSEHQMIAAEIAEGSVETPLSSEDILWLVATQKLGANASKKAKYDWAYEHTLTEQNLAEYYISECLRHRSRWTDILRG